LFDAIEWVQGDIIDIPTLERIKGIDYVYHSAALISFDPKTKAWCKTNIEGTANIVNFFLPKVKKIMLHQFDCCIR
jgi:nucleoside-diphosphate-sugar epimerase